MKPVGKLTALRPEPKGALSPLGDAEPEQQQSLPFDPQRFFEEKIKPREGSGDEVSNVPTAHFGVTEAAASDVNEPFDESMSEEMATMIGVKYISKVERGFASKVGNWESLPLPAKEAAVDAAYNLGPKVFKYEGFMGALRRGDVKDAAKNILDTAKEDGKAVKGLARRRAELYNEMVGEHKITHVEQEEDGHLVYWAGKEELFRYRPGPRHETSTVGKIRVGK